MLLHLIAAARPNFMKVAPLYHALAETGWADPVIVHTGQHYDINMSDAFFKDLRLPEPGIHLGVGSGSHAEQAGQVMIAYEKVLFREKPDLIVVVGDVNSTMAVTLTAVKLGLPVGHLEAGLRSFDRTMPEEINRLVTDALADVLWTPSPDADENLRTEGVSREKIFLVGNIMIDSLEMLRPVIEKHAVFPELGLTEREYGLVTLHRPSNVDDRNSLEAICRALAAAARNIPLVFPVHPRTRKNLLAHGLMDSLQSAPGIHLLEPMNYVRFMNLVFHCGLVITDSGGIQEETTYLGIPCLTMRPNTERPITIEQGTNRLCSTESLLHEVSNIIGRPAGRLPVIELWDGKTAKRVVRTIENMNLR
jgi:UDP-N-acetylglucosamine 2-epimerase (non-hydrolysing)